MDQFKRFAGMRRFALEGMAELARYQHDTALVTAAVRGNAPGRKGRKDRKRPPEAGLPVPAVPPKGPLPLQGGAEAPLDFDRP